MDQDKIMKAVELFLEGIGEDKNREGLVDTPKRVARMCKEIFGGLDSDASKHLKKTFSSDKSDMVLVKDISFYSVCEHHLLPFYGVAHIAYIPDGKVVGLSKLARTVEVYAKRPQIQEQLTNQVASAIMEELASKGVMVMMEAKHMCMSMRGVKKPGSKTATYVALGEFEDNMELQNRFFQMIK